MQGGPKSMANVRLLGAVSVSALLAAALIACNGGEEDSAADHRGLVLEANVQALEESLETLTAENAALKDEIAVPQGESGR